jgi:methylenetetrahydrofolate dehydrogenase (NADP+)/methenyltetrahydrofolate cyclohydrolase
MSNIETKLLSGTDLSATILSELQTEVQSLNEKSIEPCLAVILVGDDPASQIYVNHKQRACEKTGLRSIKHIMPASIEQKELLALIDELNKDPAVNGILCQLPLPQQLDEPTVIAAIDPNKDVDCFHPFNFGLLTAGTPRFMPCTPFGVLQLLKRNGITTQGKQVVVVGRSNIVGRPLSILLSLKGWDATVTLCHSRTADLAKTCRQADIVIAAIGIPEFIKGDFIKPGAVVIDVGINRIDDPDSPKGVRLVGDVDFDAAAEVAQAITPVPGGVGPMTIAMLLLNTINAARYQAQLPPIELV